MTLNLSKHLLPTLILMCILDLASAQQKNDQNLWHLTVVDSNTVKGINKVTISISKRKYYFTNSNGAIDINKTLINPNDSVIISCIGFESRIIKSQNNTEYPDTVRLSASITVLKEVRINPTDIIEAKMGDFKKAYNTHRITMPEQGLAQFIPNEKKISGIITSIEYVLNDELHGIEMPFRARLYTKREDSITLDQELTTNSIIVYNAEKKHRLSVDVSKYNIKLPGEGVIVVFETLSPSYYSKDSIWYRAPYWDNGAQYVKTPGIDMDQVKNFWKIDYGKINRTTPYCMVGPAADNWNRDGVFDQWYAYAEGINFAITITIRPD